MHSISLDTHEQIVKDLKDRLDNAIELVKYYAAKADELDDHGLEEHIKSLRSDFMIECILAKAWSKEIRRKQHTNN